jgi:hypothetical protein
MLSYNDRKFIIAAEYDFYKQQKMSYSVIIDRIVDMLECFELTDNLEAKERELMKLMD